MFSSLILVDLLANKLCCDFQILTAPLSPNESFLRYLILPQDNDLAIDLRQTAVVIMAHLDRLASPYSPPNCNSPTSHKVINLLATTRVVMFDTTPSCPLITVPNFISISSLR